jgi:hypothetical protein
MSPAQQELQLKQYYLSVNFLQRQTQLAENGLKLADLRQQPSAARLTLTIDKAHECGFCLDCP